MTSIIAQLEKQKTAIERALGIRSLDNAVRQMLTVEDELLKPGAMKKVRAAKDKPERRNQDRIPMCEDCRRLLDNYKESSRMYADSVALMRGALGLPGFNAVNNASALLRKQCSKARVKLELHRSAAHPALPH